MKGDDMHFLQCKDFTNIWMHINSHRTNMLDPNPKPHNITTMHIDLHFTKVNPHECHPHHMCKQVDLIKHNMKYS